MGGERPVVREVMFDFSGTTRGSSRPPANRLALPPAEVLMVGDDRTADAGAAALGCPVHLVDPLPVHDRPDALTRALARAAGPGFPAPDAAP